MVSSIGSRFSEDSSEIDSIVGSNVRSDGRRFGWWSGWRSEWRSGTFVDIGWFRVLRFLVSSFSSISVIR